MTLSTSTPLMAPAASARWTAAPPSTRTTPPAIASAKTPARTSPSTTILAAMCSPSRTRAGHWTDYIFAGGKRIAKADLFDTRLHISATTCNGCSGAYEVFNFNNIGDLNGHVIQSGDKRFVRQLIPSNMAGGRGFFFTNRHFRTHHPPAHDQNPQLAPSASRPHHPHSPPT